MKHIEKKPAQWVKSNSSSFLLVYSKVKQAINRNTVDGTIPNDSGLFISLICL